MLGEDVECAAFDQRGLVGDRRFALIDDETRKVVSVKRPKRWGRMFELAASTRDGTVEVRFPDDSTMSIADPGLARRLSDFLGRPVSVASTPPPGATFEEVWMRELKNDMDPYLGMPSRIEDGDEMIDGGQLMSENGTFNNGCPVHIVTTSSTSRLLQLAPDTRFDPRRFRPNIVVECDDAGFVPEREWPGQTLVIGDVRLVILVPTPRCVMTTLEQGDLPADREVLRTISEHNSLEVAGAVFPCLGLYADVASVGEIAVGDSVAVA
jgi:uncharacterized protein YcbX